MIGWIKAAGKGIMALGRADYATANLELREKNVALLEENARLRSENRSLHHELATARDYRASLDGLEKRDNVYWRGKEGTFCTRGKEADGKVISLQPGSPG